MSAVELLTCSAALGRALQAIEDMDEFARVLMAQITPLAGAQWGVMYVADDSDNRFRFAGGWGAALPEQMQGFALGEGLHGQCALDGQALDLQGLQASHLRIHSGLVDTAPCQVRIVPVPGEYASTGEFLLGNDVASRHYDQGIEAEEKLFGIPVVTTIRANQLKPLPNKRSAYIFNPQEWLGNFYLLQDATLFIKQEADQVEFWTYESIGLGIGNTNAITRIDFPAP
mgnify:CR=1 FL=1